MIKKFIDKLFGKTSAKAAVPQAEPIAALVERVEIPKSVHRIDAGAVDERAVKVVRTLSDAGYQAYIVGGAVRDLVVGLRPKDFDVATDATPEQVKALFRRAFIIGRRFRIVHVVFGRGRQERGLSEVIEVSTFRAMVESAAAEQLAGGERATRHDLAGKTHVVDAAGRVLRDNVWGSQLDDAARRDFTINAMYYDPVREIVVDYHGGFQDVQKKLLRMIGDPAARYREDPVRVIRVVRFAAKLGFEIEPRTRTPIREMAALLDNVPASRTFDEMIKLLQTGHALASIEELRKQGLHRGVFPVLDVALDEAHRHDGREKFVQRALADTDRRVGEDKPVVPSFMLACMLWHDVLDRWNQRLAQGEPSFPALQQAIDAVFEARIGDISGRGKLAADMREIWMMQPRFERRQGSSAAALVEQPRFRAAFDFMRLRADAGEIDASLADWWEQFSTVDPDARQALLEAVRGREGGGPRRVRSAPRSAASPRAAADGDRDSVGADAERGGAETADDAADHAVEAGALSASDDAEAAYDTGGSADPVRKRRRRRRRPASAETASAVVDGAGSGSTPTDQTP